MIAFIFGAFWAGVVYTVCQPVSGGLAAVMALVMGVSMWVVGIALLILTGELTENVKQQIRRKK